MRNFINDTNSLLQGYFDTAPGLNFKLHNSVQQIIFTAKGPLRSEQNCVSEPFLSFWSEGRTSNDKDAWLLSILQKLLWISLYPIT